MRRRKEKKDKVRTLDTGASISQLLSFAYPDWLLLLLAFLFLFIAAIASSLIPKYTGEVVNYVSGENPDAHKFHTAIYLLTASAICSGVFSGFRGAVFTVTMARINVRIRNSFLESLMGQEQGFFDETKIGDITSRLAADTTKMSDQIALNMNVFLRSVVESTIVLYMMFRLSWRLTFLSFVAIPLMVLISKKYGEWYRKLSANTQTALANANGVAEEALSNIATVRDFAASKNEIEGYKEELAVFYRLNNQMALAYSGFALTWTTLPSLVTALTLYTGGQMVLNRDTHEACGTSGQLCGGDLISFIFYQQALTANLQTVGIIFTGIAGALGAADKVFQLLNRVSTLREDLYEDMALDEFQPSMEFKDVYMKYPTRDIVVLKKFSLKVDPGSVVALVGESGGGKSTVIKLLLRYYEPYAGEVLISNRPVHTFDPTWLRKRLSVVAQSPVLFGRTIARNIVYGLEEENVSMDRIVEAAKLANAHEFIMKLPKQYNTLVGERGTQLSGGQRQRVAIARAMIRYGGNYFLYGWKYCI